MLYGPELPANPTPEPAPAGNHPTLANARRDFWVLNRTADVYKRATELAEEQIRKYQREGEDYGGRKLTKVSTWAGERVFKAVNKKKFHLLDEYYRGKWTEQAAQAMLANNNSYLEMDLLRGAVTDATRKVAEEREAGKAKVETKKIEVEERSGNPPDVQDLSGPIKVEMVAQVIRPAIEAAQSGTPLTEEALQKMLAQFVEDHKGDALIKDMFGTNATEFGAQAKYFASDILDMAQQVSRDISASAYALDQIEDHIDVKVSKSDWARRTVVNRGKAGVVIDKLVAFGRKNRVGGYFLNPATVGAVWSVGSYALTSGVRSGAKAGSWALLPVAPVISPMLVSGGFAAMRRWREVKVDRAMHMGEMAYGGVINPADGTVRQEMEATAYETANIRELIEGGGQDVVRGKDREALQAMLLQLRSDPGNAELHQDLISRAAEIRARSDQAGIDKIRFSGREVIEQERLELLQNMVAIRRALLSAGVVDTFIDSSIDASQAQWQAVFDKNISDQDLKFRKYQAGQVGKAFIKGAATGFLVGFASREIGDAIIHIADRTQPLLTDKLYEAFQTDSSRGALHRLSEFMGGTRIHPDVQDVKELYVDGGEFDAGHYTVSVDPVSHEISILDKNLPIDPATGYHQEVFDNLDIKLLEDGQIDLSGAIDQDLQGELQDILNSLQNEGFHIDAYDQADLDAIPPPNETLFTAAGNHIDSTTGFPVQIPDGTKWVEEDPVAGTWKLVLESDEDTSVVEHVQFDANGHMTAWEVNPDIDPTIVDISEGSITTVSPEDALKKWDEVGTQIDKREWYAYDKAGSQNNELRAYTIKDGKKLILDMSRMGTAYQRGLNPNPIHVPDYFKPPTTPENGLLGWAFSLPGHADKPIFIHDGIDGSYDGRLVLDPDSPVIVPGTGTPGMTLGEITNLIIDGNRLDDFDDGDISTEYHTMIKGENRRDLFKLGLDGRMGTFEAGRYVEQNGQKIFQAFATGLGSGQLGGETGEIPSIGITDDITKAMQNVGYTITPPSDFGPMIIAGHAGRRPMESLQLGTARERRTLHEEPLEYYYSEGLFPRGLRLRDVLRTQRGLQRDASYGATGVFDADNSESRSALEQARQGLESAERVYVVLGGAIGDAVISSAYVHGIRGALRQLGKNTPMTLLVNNNQIKLFEGLADGQINIVGVDRDNGVNEAQSLINNSSETNALIVDFEHYSGYYPSVTSETGQSGKTVVSLSHLFPAAIELYNNTSDSERRYSHFVEELFSLDSNSLPVSEVQPVVKLPDNHDQIYTDIAQRFGIDSSKRQVAVVVESQIAGKRYSIDHWAEVMAEIAGEYDDCEFNVIFNPNAGSSGYSEAQMRTLFQNVRLDQGNLNDRVHLVNGDLGEMAVFLGYQDLVLSNDTGLAHVAAAVESGPRVATVFMPKSFSPEFWASTDRQIPVALSRAESSTLPHVDIHETDENLKLINRIPSTRISQLAIGLLRGPYRGRPRPNNVVSPSVLRLETPSPTPAPTPGTPDIVESTAVVTPRAIPLTPIMPPAPLTPADVVIGTEPILAPTPSPIPASKPIPTPEPEPTPPAETITPAEITTDEPIPTLDMISSDLQSRPEAVREATVHLDAEQVAGLFDTMQFNNGEVLELIHLQDISARSIFVNAVNSHDNVPAFTIHGRVNTSVGGAQFDVTFMNGPAENLVVRGQQRTLDADYTGSESALVRAVEGLLPSTVSTLGLTLGDQGWEVQGMNIADGELHISFRRIPEVTVESGVSADPSTSPMGLPITIPPSQPPVSSPTPAPTPAPTPTPVPPSATPATPVDPVAPAPSGAAAPTIIREPEQEVRDEVEAAGEPAEPGTPAEPDEGGPSGEAEAESAVVLEGEPLTPVMQKILESLRKRPEAVRNASVLLDDTDMIELFTPFTLQWEGQQLQGNMMDMFITHNEGGSISMMGSFIPPTGETVTYTLNYANKDGMMRSQRSVFNGGPTNEAYINDIETSLKRVLRNARQRINSQIEQEGWRLQHIHIASDGTFVVSFDRGTPVQDESPQRAGVLRGPLAQPVRPAQPAAVPVDHEHEQSVGVTTESKLEQRVESGGSASSFTDRLASHLRRIHAGEYPNMPRMAIHESDMRQLFSELSVRHGEQGEGSIEIMPINDMRVEFNAERERLIIVGQIPSSGEPSSFGVAFANRGTQGDDLNVVNVITRLGSELQQREVDIQQALRAMPFGLEDDINARLEGEFVVDKMTLEEDGNIVVTFSQRIIRRPDGDDSIPDAGLEPEREPVSEVTAEAAVRSPMRTSAGQPRRGTPAIAQSEGVAVEQQLEDRGSEGRAEAAHDVIVEGQNPVINWISSELAKMSTGEGNTSYSLYLNSEQIAQLFDQIMIETGDRRIIAQLLDGNLTLPDPNRPIFHLNARVHTSSGDVMVELPFIMNKRVGLKINSEKMIVDPLQNFNGKVEDVRQGIEGLVDFTRHRIDESIDQGWEVDSMRIHKNGQLGVNFIRRQTDGQLEDGGVLSEGDGAAAEVGPLVQALSEPVVPLENEQGQTDATGGGEDPAVQAVLSQLEARADDHAGEKKRAKSVRGGNGNGGRRQNRGDAEFDEEFEMAETQRGARGKGKNRKGDQRNQGVRSGRRRYVPEEAEDVDLIEAEEAAAEAEILPEAVEVSEAVDREPGKPEDGEGEQPGEPGPEEEGNGETAAESSAEVSVSVFDRINNYIRELGRRQSGEVSVSTEEFQKLLEGIPLFEGDLPVTVSGLDFVSDQNDHTTDVLSLNMSTRMNNDAAESMAMVLLENDSDRNLHTVSSTLRPADEHRDFKADLEASLNNLAALTRDRLQSHLPKGWTVVSMTLEENGNVTIRLKKPQNRRPRQESESGESGGVVSAGEPTLEAEGEATEEAVEADSDVVGLADGASADDTIVAEAAAVVEDSEIDQREIRFRENFDAQRGTFAETTLDYRGRKGTFFDDIKRTLEAAGDYSNVEVGLFEDDVRRLFYHIPLVDNDYPLHVSTIEQRKSYEDDPQKKRTGYDCTGNVLDMQGPENQIRCNFSLVTQPGDQEGVLSLENPEVGLHPSNKDLQEYEGRLQAGLEDILERAKQRLQDEIGHEWNVRGLKVVNGLIALDFARAS